METGYSKRNVSRNIRMGWLLDFYGNLLTPRQRQALSLHYNEDLSLAEIAEQQGISRQGVHDALQRGEATLDRYEERLGMLKRYQQMKTRLLALRDKIGKRSQTLNEKELLQDIDEILDEI